MCGVLGVPRSTYYWAISHPEPEPANDPIAADVVWIYGGPPRIRRPEDKARAGEGGHRVPRRRIKRIMNQEGLVGAYARKKCKPRAAKASEAEAPNVLDREFDGRPPHTHIAGDPAYVRVGGEWNYACLPIDLRDREIAGRAASGSRTRGR